MGQLATYPSVRKLREWTINGLIPGTSLATRRLQIEPSRIAGIYMSGHQSKSEHEVQVVILSGPESAERAVFGFSSALAAAASGVSVRVVLSMYGAYWAASTTGQGVSVTDFPPVAELLEQLAELKVPLEACSTCVDNFCPSPLDDHGLRVLRHGIVRIGLGVVAMRMASANTILC